MKQKLVFTLAVIFSFALTASSQLQHSVGGGLVYGTGKLPQGAEGSYDEPTILGYGIFYYPRYNISETESGAISVGVPLTGGLSGSVNSRTGGSLTVLLDLPVTVDYNFGAGSTIDNESGFGGFIGAGFGYTYSNYTDEFYIPGAIETYEQVKGSSYGPLAHAGIKALIGEKVYFLRVSYKLGLESAKFKTFGISAGLSF